MTTLVEKVVGALLESEVGDFLDEELAARAAIQVVLNEMLDLGSEEIAGGRWSDPIHWRATIINFAKHHHIDLT